MAGKKKFAGRLRWWRAQRGLSQLALAERAGVSQRHVSFLELGRASPSREMVERIAAALALPLREHTDGRGHRRAFTGLGGLKPAAGRPSGRGPIGSKKSPFL